MRKSKLSFERSCRVFNDLSNKEAIDKAFKSFQQPLNDLNEMEKKIQEMEISSMKKYIEDQQNKIEGTKKELDEIEKKLKAKSDEITNEIQEIREKYGEKKEDLDEFTPSGLVNIETENFYKEVISNTQAINDQIKIINQSLNDNMEIIKQNSRLDLLFIMDITNSMDVYLDQVKRQVLDIIHEIRKECAGIEIYIGFIGYRDFSDLDFGESYINLELTEKYENIIQNIKYLKAEGGGDIPEDLCGALEFAKEKQWKGKSRFAILVTDSPCHGRKYYDDTTENFDNYPDGDREGRNIEEYIKFLAENEISVFCLKVSPSTDKMFKIFEEIYNTNKRKDCNNQFMADIGENIFNVVTSNAIKTFQNRKVEDIKE
jgi:myosin protein heavy chain